jgi:hypothetical protein
VPLSYLKLLLECSILLLALLHQLGVLVRIFLTKLSLG